MPGNTALVIGAGKVYDIPLVPLVERYEKLVLVDIDANALESTVARVISKPEHRARVELVCMDVTGIAEPAQTAVDRLIASESSEHAAYEALLALLYSYHGTPAPLLFPEGRVDTIYSVMVLTQLAAPLTHYIESRFLERFPSTALTSDRRFQIALGQFTHRVQHAHVRAILGSCRSFCISSDVSEHYTEVRRDGGLAAVSGELPLIGAQQLSELLPSDIERVATVAWEWPRIVPKPGGKPGTTLRVNGLVGVVRSA